MGEDSFSAEDIINSVTDGIAAITASDVIALVTKANDMGKAIEMGDFLIQKRPDLEDDIEDAVGDALARF
jgi:hypothetical protein